MPKTRGQKAEELALIEEALDGKAAVLTQYTGLSVRDLDELRSSVRGIGGKYRVVKTSLLAKALKERGIEVPANALTVQLGIASSATDEVEPNKVVVEFAKSHEALGILGAVIDGAYVDEAQVRTLAALPGRDELYAQVVGSIRAPLVGLVNVLGGNIRGLVSVLGQYAATKQ